MAGKGMGYVIGGLEIVAGVVLSLLGLPEVGIPLAISGAAQVAGTALTPAPPRTKSLRDSPNYGIDTIENPRGADAVMPIPFGNPRVKPVVIAESVSSVAENNSPGVDAQRRQGVKWLGAVGEGPIEGIEDIEINDRRALSDLLTGQDLGKGNGSKKEFALPHRWVYLGDDEHPAVDVFVDGVLKSYSRRTASPAEFTVPSGSGRFTVDLRRDDKRERILEDSIRIYIRGTGHPEAEQPRRTGAYKWGLSKLAPYRVRIKFRTRPPTGFVVKVAYDYLGSEGLALAQDIKGNTKAVFGTAPANGKQVTASYRTTPFPGLRIRWRPGTLDQSPIPGFTDSEQTFNPRSTLLLQDQATPNPPYSTAGREVDDLRIGIVAPRGFIRYKDDGGTDRVSAKIRIEYRKSGTSTWITLRAPSGNDYFFLSAERPSTVRWEIGIRDTWQTLFDGGDNDAGDRLADFDRAAYEVRVTRLDKPSSDALVADELNFQTVTEVVREGFVYPGTALLALSAMPNEIISGGSLRVSCVVKRGKVYDPRTVAHYGRRDLGSSQNPFLAIRDLVTSAEGKAKERYGAGFFFAGQDFFLGTDGRTTGTAPNEQPKTDGNGFIAACDFADEWIHRSGDDATKPPYTATYGSVPPYSSNNGERRCRLNLVLDTPQSLMETVGDIAFLGYCFASLQGAKWRFPLDQDGDAVFTFVDEADPPNQNASKIVLNLEAWGKTPTGIQGSFWNEALGFDRDELLYPVDALPEGTPTNIKQVDLRGCSRESEAARMLRHLAEQAKALPLPVSWEAHPGVQHIEAGDIVTLKTRLPYSTGTSATELKVRVLAGMVGRDDMGKLTVRYAGRVMKSSAYALRTVTVPVSPPKSALTGGTGKRVVTNLRARVAA